MNTEMLKKWGNRSTLFWIIVILLFSSYSAQAGDLFKIKFPGEHPYIFSWDPTVHDAALHFGRDVIATSAVYNFQKVLKLTEKPAGMTRVFMYAAFIGLESGQASWKDGDKQGRFDISEVLFPILTAELTIWINKKLWGD